MGEEQKTEQPTPKKRQDARQEGQVAQSSEITNGMQLFVAGLWFWLEGPKLLAGIQDAFRKTVVATTLPFDQALGQTVLVCCGVLMRFIGSLIFALLLITVLTGIVQTGFLFVPKKLMPKLDGLNPVSNAKNLFSIKKLYTLFLILFKVGLLALVFAYILNRYGRTLIYLPGCGIPCAIPVVAKLCSWLLGSLIGFYIVLSAIDYLFEYRQIMKQLRMSKEDIKQEFKNIERNPAIKQRMRAMHSEMQNSDMPSRVARSSAVVRNPSHLAVCLYYKPGETPLPVVTEKGAGYHALRVLEFARRYKVPIIANVTLARQLMADTQIDDVIPEELFEPVAEVLRLAMLAADEEDELNEEDEPDEEDAPDEKNERDEGGESDEKDEQNDSAAV